MAHVLISKSARKLFNCYSLSAGGLFPLPINDLAFFSTLKMRFFESIEAVSPSILIYATSSKAGHARVELAHASNNSVASSSESSKSTAVQGLALILIS
jgi:hypothetical protein